MGWFQQSHLKVVESDSEAFDEQNISSDAEVSKEGDDAELKCSIEDVMNMFDCLPNRGSDIESVAVVSALASFDVGVEDIVKDAKDKEELTIKRLKVLQLEIELFKAKIRNRQKEMALLKYGLGEMAKTQQQLHRGEEIINKKTNRFIPRIKKRTVPKAKILKDKPVAEQIKNAAMKEVFAKTQKIDIANLYRAPKRVATTKLRKK
jgi:hypothetical protein